MKRFFIVTFLLITTFLLKAQTNRLIITEPQLLFLINLPDDISMNNALMRLPYDAKKDNIFLRILFTQSQKHISKITLSKNNTQFTLEEDINATEHLIDILERARAFVKQNDKNNYQFLIPNSGKGITISSLKIEGENFKFTNTKVNENQISNEELKRFSKLIRNSSLHQQIVNESKEQANNALLVKKQNAQKKEIKQKQIEYLSVPFYQETIPSYFGWTKKTLKNQLIYTDSYISLKDTVQENSFIRFYTNYVKLTKHETQILNSTIYQDRQSKKQPITILTSKDKELIGIRYNIESNSTSSYLSAWIKKGAKEISSNDKTVTYEYNYSQKVHNGYQYIALYIIIEKKPIKESERRVNILVKNIRHEKFYF